MKIVNMLAAGVIAASAAALPARALDVTEATSPGGVDFWLVEEPSIPMVALEIRFAGGGRLDPEGMPGLANMTVSLLSEGAGARDAVAFANERDRLSARFGFSAGRDAVTVSARMLSETASESAALLATALSEPRFDPDPVARVRGQILSSIASSKTDPASMARKAWYARAFPDHPYGTPTNGTEEGVAGITVEDMKAMRAELLTRSSATVGIVGDVDVEAAGALVDTILADLPEGDPHAAEAVAGTPPPGTEVVALDVPQSAAIFGHSGIDRDDPDFIPAYVMNYILGGGGLSTRLMEEVREKRGLAYGVYSYLQDLDAANLYLGSVQTANDRMAESLDVIRAEWSRMRDEGVTEEELDRAKKYLTGAFALRFDSNAKIAGYLVFAQVEGLGLDYFDRRNALIRAVTIEDANRAAERLLDPDALSITVVGQPAGL